MIVTILACTLLVLGIVATQGHVSGEEFAPSHFQSRHFSFYEIPVLHLQVSPISRSGTTGGTATTIRQTSLIRTPKGTPKIWHLVSISRGVTGNTPADAKLLVDQLAMQQDGSDFWSVWNKKYLSHAKVLWPVVQRLAERELYVLIPELLVLARSSGDEISPQSLNEKIDAYLIEEYTSLIQDMRLANRADLADAFLSELKLDFPDREFPKLFKMQIKSESPADSDAGSDEASDR